MTTSDGGERPKRRDREAEHGHDDALVDEASVASFPASDPPPFSHSHAGTPLPEEPAPSAGPKHDG